MTDEDFSTGEIQRSLARLEKGLMELTSEVRDRHHKISAEVNGAVGPISTLGLRMSNAEKQLERMDCDIASVSTRSAYISGAVAAILVVVQIVIGIWKH